MAELIDLRGQTLMPVLDWLLRDQTTKQHILFAAEDRADRGADYAPESPMTTEKLLRENCPVSIHPGTEKAAASRQTRAQKKSTLFPPAWMINHQNNIFDAAWFGREESFNHEKARSWVPLPEPIAFPEGKSWQDYVNSPRLQTACGEALLIVSRYDSAAGKLIPIKKRMGMLDRKLRVVNENASDDAEWLHWTERAFQCVYGYEFRGDRLLAARANLLLTFAEYYEARFGTEPGPRLLRKYANIISWNFWQMDELTGKVPCAEKKAQLSLFDFLEPKGESAPIPPCRVMDWGQGHPVDFEDAWQQEESAMKWDFIIDHSSKKNNTGKHPAAENESGFHAEGDGEAGEEPGLF